MIEPGTQVLTIAKLHETTGMLIHERHLSVRKPGTYGVVKSYVPGHGGDVWFVQHTGSDEVGAYSTLELIELGKEGLNKLTPRKCSCGNTVCNRYGFEEGTFYQGCGFDKEDAEKIAMAFNNFDDLLRVVEMWHGWDYHVQSAKQNGESIYSNEYFIRMREEASVKTYELLHRLGKV